MRNLILNNKFMNWIEKNTIKYKNINDGSFLYNDGLDDIDVEYGCSLKYFFNELNKYNVCNNNYSSSVYYIRYNGNIYSFSYDGNHYFCEKVDNCDKKIIDYKTFRNSYKKSTDEIFSELRDTVKKSLIKSDLDLINKELSTINDSTIVTGVGGSNVVSDFASKVLNQKNGIVTRNSEVRDLLYMNLDSYKNVLSCSYSGKNYGVEMAFLNNLKKYLLTAKDNNYKDVSILKYDMEPEDSFISLGSTLVPCSILLNYYLDGDKSFINDIHEYNFDFDPKCDCFEIFSGYDTSTLSNYLDSTMVEAGIGIPVVHDKYAYCHGRSTLSKNNNNIAIYFNRDTDLDKMMLEELPKYYKSVVKIDVAKGLEGEYRALVEVMYLTKYLSDVNKMSLSNVDYSPIVKKLYYFKKGL